MITTKLPPAWRDLKSLPRQLFFWFGACAILGSTAGDLLLGRPVALLLLGSAVLLALAWQCFQPKLSSLTLWLLLSTFFALNLITRTPAVNAPTGPVFTPPREAILDIRLLRLSEEIIGETSRIRGQARVLRAPPPFQEWEGRKILVRFDAIGEVPSSGAIWRVQGVLTPFPPELGELYPWTSAQTRRGVSGSLNRGWGQLLQPASPWTSFWQDLRGKTRLRIYGPEPERRLLAGLLLGDRASLSLEQVTILRETGTLHFFAISGLHMGFIAGGLILLGRVIRIPRPYIGGLVMGGLLFYLSLIGAPPSALRAVLMVSCFLLAGWLGRPSTPILGLALSAGLTLLIWPEQWWDLGFRLSHLVVASILLYAEPLRWYIQPGLHRHPGQLPVLASSLQRKTLTFGYGMICVGVASFCASTPLLVEAQGVAAWSGILLNFPLYALILSALGIGLSGLMFSCLLPLPFLWEPLLALAQLFLEIALTLATLVHSWEGSRILASWQSPTWGGILTLLLLLAWICPVRPGIVGPALKLGFPLLLITWALILG